MYYHILPASPVTVFRIPVESHHPVGVLFPLRPQVTYRYVFVRVVLYEVAVFQQPLVALVDDCQPFGVRERHSRHIHHVLQVLQDVRTLGEQLGVPERDG